MRSGVDAGGDARAVAYGLHSHDTVSVGLFTGGRSLYRHERGAGRRAH